MTPAEKLAWAETKEGVHAAREFLSGGQQIEAMIGLRLARLEKLRDHARRVTRAVEASCGRSGFRGDAMAEAVADTVAMEKELLQDYHNLLDKQKEIQQVIDRIPDDFQRMVLELRYLQGISMLGIARRLNYDERTVQRIHHKALSQVAVRLAVDQEI